MLAAHSSSHAGVLLSVLLCCAHLASPLPQVVRLWAGQLHYSRQLQVAARQTAELRDWWWLQQCLQRWVRVTEAMRGQRNEELRRLVQLRACIG